LFFVLTLVVVFVFPVMPYVLDVVEFRAKMPFKTERCHRSQKPIKQGIFATQDYSIASFLNYKKRQHFADILHKRYNTKTYDDIRLRVPKGEKDKIQAFAEINGESLNGFINRLISEAMAGVDKTDGSSSKL